MRQDLKKYAFLLVFLSLLILSGCPRTWYFTITDVTDPKYPHFCVSRSKIFKNLGLGFSVFDIYEVNEKGERIRDVWEIRPKEDVTLNMLIYGTPPKGFKQVMKPIPLEIGKFYAVHGTYFFRLNQIGNDVEPEIYDHKQLFTSLHQGKTPWKRNK